MEIVGKLAVELIEDVAKEYYLTLPKDLDDVFTVLRYTYYNDKLQNRWRIEAEKEALCARSM
jgi:hypothetical protein